MDLLPRRLLRALLESSAPSCTLVGGGDGRALLQTSTGAVVALINHPGDEELPALRARLDEAMGLLKRGQLHLLVVGGSGEIANLLGTLKPRFQFSRRYGFHHVDDAGRYAWIDGPRLALLEMAALHAPELPPLTDEEIANIPPPSADFEREQRFAAAVQSGAPTVTIALAVACGLVFALQLYFARYGETLATLRLGADRGELVRQGQIWRLLSSAFLHGDPKHIIFNLIALFSFGPLLERILGARRYLVLYAASALGGSLLSAFGHPAVTSVGASGALWGLMAAGGGLALRPRDLISPGMVLRLRKQVWIPVIINGLYSLQPGVDLLAHLGGGLVGLALVGTGLLTARLAPIDAPAPRERGKISTVAAALSALALAGSVAVAVAHGRPWELAAPPPVERVTLGDSGISVELPRGLARTIEKDAFEFGSFDRDPVLFEVILTEPHGTLEPSQHDAHAKLLEADFDKGGLDGASRVGTLRIETIAERATVLKEERFANNIVARSWLFHLWDRDIVVRAYLRPDARPEWRAAADAAVRSVQTEGPARDERLCSGGDLSACSHFGWLLARGRGLPVDQPRAAALWRRACDGNIPSACNYLGDALENGRGLPADLPAAARLYEKSCDGKDPYGCTGAGLAHENGRGVPADPKRAVSFYQLACDGGDPAGCFDLALAHEYGIAGPRDDAKAAPLYEKSCNSEYFDACTNLAAFYAAGRSVPRDEARAKSLREKACDGGDPLACKLLGRTPPKTP